MTHTNRLVIKIDGRFTKRRAKGHVQENKVSKVVNLPVTYTNGSIVSTLLELIHLYKGLDIIFYIILCLLAVITAASSRINIYI